MMCTYLYIGFKICQLETKNIIIYACIYTYNHIEENYSMRVTIQNNRMLRFVFIFVI